MLFFLLCFFLIGSNNYHPPIYKQEQKKGLGLRLLEEVKGKKEKKEKKI
jgi:hypothetical protein